MTTRGRPSLYSEELASRICERLSAGETLLAICKDDDMPAEATVRAWALDDYKGFSANYARARELGYSRLADELTAIADDKTGDAARDRLRVDTRKWLLSKALPKVYGDKIAHVGGSEADPPIRTVTRIEIVDLTAEAPKDAA